MIITIFFFYKIHYILILHHGAVVVMIVRMLNLELHLHSEHITTKIHRGVLATTLCDTLFSDLRHGGGFSGYSVSSNNITERHDIAERLLKVV